MPVWQPAETFLARTCASRRHAGRWTSPRPKGVSPQPANVDPRHDEATAAKVQRRIMKDGTVGWSQRGTNVPATGQVQYLPHTAPAGGG